MLDHILIVDESRLVREALAKILLSCGINKSAIACIESIEDAIEYAQIATISLLICSDNLSEMDSFTFRDELIKAAKVEQLPLLILSHQHNDEKSDERAGMSIPVVPKLNNATQSLCLLPPFQKKRQ